MAPKLLNGKQIGMGPYGICFAQTRNKTARRCPTVSARSSTVGIRTGLDEGSEMILMGYPVVPVRDGLGGSVIHADGLKLGERHAQ